MMIMIMLLIIMMILTTTTIMIVLGNKKGMVPTNIYPIFPTTQIPVLQTL